jgi:predicted phosphodiesterase
MRVAVISDIHANLEAFSQVLADIERIGVDAVFCLGDIIGYGPEPEASVLRLRRQEIPAVMGNHELGLTSEPYMRLMNESARRALVITKKLLSDESMQYLLALPPTLSAYGARFVHGCPPASATIYLFDPDEPLLKKLFTTFVEDICFVGHTHNLALFGFDGSRVSKEGLTQGIVRLSPDSRYIVNVGSVGQPRDRQNNNAKYVIWDQALNTIEVRFVDYDVGVTVDKIMELGFPPSNAIRLW